MATRSGLLRLGDVCSKIGSGATPRGGKEAYLESGPYSLIRSQNIRNDGFNRAGLVFIGDEQARALDNVAVESRDVLLNITGDSVARVCQVADDVLPARVNQHVAIIRPDPEILDPRFLRYWLVSPPVQSHLLGWSSAGATRNALTKAMIENLAVPALDIDEQRRIAHILGTLDDKIELNRRMNETLEEMARALFKSWFVDFDPVRAKAEGRDTGLPKHLADLFPDRLVDSELGPIPTGWAVKSLRDVAHEARHGVNPSSTPEVTYDHYSLPAFDAGRMPVRESGSAIRSNKYAVTHGSVLLSKLNPETPRVWVPRPSEVVPSICSTEFVVLEPIGRVSQAWLFGLLSSSPFAQTLAELVTGTSKSHQRVQKDALFRVSVVVPDAAVLDAVTPVLAQMLDRVAVSRDEVRTLHACREAVSRELFA